MVDKLAFVKTLEAILAAVVAMSLYNFLQSQISSQAGTFKRSPNTLINDFLDANELSIIINEYDYLKLDSLFQYLFFETIYYYFEPIYHERLLITTNNDSPRNISFIYHFPQGIDHNSVRLFSEDYELDTKALFNYKKVPITFNESIIDEYIPINISLEESGINNESFRFYVKGKESLASLIYWEQGPSSSNASLIVYVPEIDEDEICYIYYSKGLYNNITYPSLSETKVVGVTAYNSQEARTADVFFTVDSASTTNTYYLKYKLFSTDENNYKDFTLINNTDVIIDIKKEELKEGNAPYTTTIKGENAVKRIIPINDGFVELVVYGDYS